MPSPIAPNETDMPRSAMALRTVLLGTSAESRSTDTEVEMLVVAGEIQGDLDHIDYAVTDITHSCCFSTR